MATRMIKLTAVGLVAVLMTACSPNSGPRETGGTLIGAALGGLAGSQFGKGGGKIAAIAVGTLIGGVLGNNVGKSLDKVDRLHAKRTAERSLESGATGQVSTWSNPDSGNSGTFSPTRTYKTTEGAYCREYQQTITVGGRTVDGHGTACRQPDGTWKIVDAT